MSKEEILSNFQFYGITPSKEVVDKCVEVCSKYDVEAEELVDQWSAHAATQLIKNEPTLEDVIAIERKVFSKAAPKNTSYNQLELIEPESSTPKPPKSAKRVHTPEEDTPSKKLQLELLQLDSTNKTGNVAISFGSIPATFKGEFRNPVQIRQRTEFPLLANARYMYETALSKADTINFLTDSVGRAIVKKNNLEDVVSFAHRAAGVVNTYGRISCDCNGKLNHASVLLGGTHDLSGYHSIGLNMNRLQRYSVFPGQTVAVQGININSNVFLAQEMFTDVFLEFSSDEIKVEETLQIVVAAGPFTQFNNLSYQPLQDLLKYVVNHKPQVLILLGPLIDASNESIKDGDLSESFVSFFHALIEMIMIPLERSKTQVLLVASHKDVHHHVVYPTPPYFTKHNFPNLHCLPDPCMVSINGVVMGLTSTDILFHLSNEEISHNMPGDRMGRLARHILNQKTFYPLHPAPVSMDHRLMEQHALMEVCPHILVLPSNLRYFIKDVSGCLVVNPERLAKGLFGGTFARFEIPPTTRIGSLIDGIACQLVHI